MLGRHRRQPGAPVFDVQQQVANCKVAIRAAARAQDLCDQQEIAALNLVVHEQQRIVDLDNRAITLLRQRLVYATRPGVQA